MGKAFATWSSGTLAYRLTIQGVTAVLSRCAWHPGAPARAEYRSTEPLSLAAGLWRRSRDSPYRWPGSSRRPRPGKSSSGRFTRHPPARRSERQIRPSSLTPVPLLDPSYKFPRRHRDRTLRLLYRHRPLSRQRERSGQIAKSQRCFPVVVLVQDWGLRNLRGMKRPTSTLVTFPGLAVSSAVAMLPALGSRVFQ